MKYLNSSSKLETKRLVSERKNWYHYKQERPEKFKEAGWSCLIDMNVK
jgi:hypothetical protein